MWFSKIGDLEDDSDLEDAEIGKAVLKAENNKKSYEFISGIAIRIQICNFEFGIRRFSHK